MKTYRCLNCNTEQKHRGVNYANKYCNNKCQGEHKTKLWYEKYQPIFDAGDIKSRKAAKKLVTRRDGYQCSICNQQPMHNGRPLIMIIDHIDGDASNNIPDNFRLVCPNCDTQLPTYKAKNTGNGRATKGMKWYSQL